MPPKLSCSTKCITYFVFLWNLIFVIGGLILLIVGIIKTLEIDASLTILKRINNLRVAPTMAIVVGVLIFGIAFLGCWGAHKKNTCMLISYGIIVLIILFFQILIAIVAFNATQETNGEFKLLITKDVKKAFQDYNFNRNKKNFDDIQQEFRCCGVYGPKDWINNTRSKDIPASCCKGNSQPCSDPFKPGCIDQIYSKVRLALIILASFSIAFLATELVASVGAFYMRYQIKKDNSVG